MKKVLVTGGAGYIGSVLVRLLLQQQYHVVVVDNPSFGGESIVELLNDPNFTFVKGDIRDAELMSQYFKVLIMWHIWQQLWAIRALKPRVNPFHQFGQC